jgi:hypothetical protein
MQKLTTASHDLFIAYADDAGNWSGTPLVGGNVPASKEATGNLTDLKRKGLLETFEDDGEVWVRFTDAGVAYATQHGVEDIAFYYN